MSTLIRRARVALSVAALAACSFGHAATSPKAPAPVVATRTAPVAVKNVTPDDGAQRVDTLAQVKVTFDGAIDPASMTRAHVVLSNRGVPLGSVLSYDDATHRITIKPVDVDGPLVHAATFTVKISGLLDTFGRAVTPFQSRFSTSLDPARFDKSIYRSGPDGAIAGRDRTSYDADGHRTRFVSYGGAGADGKWGTADDVVVGWSRFDLRPDGLESGQRDFYGPGLDGVWFTADDLSSSYSIDTYTPAGAPLESAWHYDDAQSEACCAFSMHFSYDAAGVQTGMSSHQPGADGILDTADDDVVVETNNYDALGRYIGYVDRVGGAVTSYGVRTWRADRRIDSTTHYWSVGPDGIPYTADDVPGSVYAYTYDKRGNLIRTTYYHDAGPDGVWHTADDIPSGYTRYWVDDTDNVVKLVSYDGPGRDGIWFTDDDVEISQSKYDPTR